VNLELILIALGCLVSLLNLLATIFLSNAVFRFLAEDRNNLHSANPRASAKISGLVDVSETPTYDPRFRGS